VWQISLGLGGHGLGPRGGSGANFYYRREVNFQFLRYIGNCALSARTPLRLKAPPLGLRLDGCCLAEIAYFEPFGFSGALGALNSEVPKKLGFFLKMSDLEPIVPCPAVVPVRRVNGALGQTSLPYNTDGGVKNHCLALFFWQEISEEIKKKKSSWPQKTQKIRVLKLSLR